MNTQHPSSALPSVLSFEGADLKIIDHDGHPWIAAADLGRALGYKRGDHVASIYRQHAGEFCEAMTTVITLEAAKSAVNGDSALKGNPNVTVRIFSPRGAHLIAMFARTAKATAFRRWVLDVLEQFDRAPIAGAEPVDALAALRQTRVLFMLDGYGQPHAQNVPDDACVVQPDALPELLGNPAYVSRQQAEAAAVALLQRLVEEGGERAVRRALVEVNPNWLLVDEIDFRHVHNSFSLMLMQQVAGKKGGSDEV